MLLKEMRTRCAEQERSDSSLLIIAGAPYACINSRKERGKKRKERLSTCTTSAAQRRTRSCLCCRSSAGRQS